jgi:hypothetical protein
LQQFPNTIRGGEKKKKLKATKNLHDVCDLHASIAQQEKKELGRRNLFSKMETISGLKM